MQDNGRNDRDPQVMAKVNDHTAHREELEYFLIVHMVRLLPQYVLETINNLPGTGGKQCRHDEGAVNRIQEYVADIAVVARIVNAIKKYWSNDEKRIYCRLAQFTLVTLYFLAPNLVDHTLREEVSMIIHHHSVSVEVLVIDFVLEEIEGEADNWAEQE